MRPMELSESVTVRRRHENEENDRATSDGKMLRYDATDDDTVILAVASNSSAALRRCRILLRRFLMSLDASSLVHSCC